LYTVYLQDTSVPKSKYEDVYINNHTGVHGGRIISGAINAASRLLKTVTAQVWLELRLLKLQQI